MPPPPPPPPKFAPLDATTGENGDGAKFETCPPPVAAADASHMPTEEVSFSLKLRGARKPAPLPPLSPPPPPPPDAEDETLERRLQGQKFNPVETSPTHYTFLQEIVSC